MPSVIQTIVALEMMLLPLWVGTVLVGPAPSLAARVARAPAAVVVVAAVLLVLAVVAEDGAVVGVLRSQAVAVGWVFLLSGLAAVADRVAGPRAAQVLTALAGWAIIGAMILAGPLVEMVGDAAKATVVQAIVHANPLMVAEQELGLKWTHQALTYRWTPLGESYSYLFGHPAWWKTLLGHLFVGSGLLMFSFRRTLPDALALPIDER